MGLLSLLRSGPSAAIDDERLWTRSGYAGGGYYQQTTTGVPVSADSSFAVSCIFQGVRLYAETLGSLPLKLYRDGADGVRSELRTDPRWRLLRRKPNPWQTAQQFRETLTAWALGWGIGAAEIKPGRSGAFDSLWPIHPDWLTVDHSRDTGRVRFHVDEPGQSRRTLLQEQVFRVEHFGLQRILGESVLKRCREVIGIWVAHEKFAGLFFGQGARPSVWLQHPKTLSDTAYKHLQEHSASRYGGLSNHHKVAIVEEGVQVKETGFNAEQAQMTESRADLVHDFARWLNLPIHMLMSGDQPTFASIQEFSQQLVDYSFRPWATRWEQSFLRDLCLEDEDDLMIEFLFEGLLRGKTLERFQAYAVGIQNGFMSENEVRGKENLAPYPGLDEPRRSANQDRGADPAKQEPPPATKPKPSTPPSPPGRKRGESDQLLVIAEGAAHRLITQEIKALTGKGAKLAGDPDAWAGFLVEFYGDFAIRVSETLDIGLVSARRFADAHREKLASGGLSVLEATPWESEGVEALLELIVN